MSGVVRVLAHDMGLQLPGDMALAGHGNSPLCRYMRPMLTSMSEPWDDIVGTGVHLFEEQLDRKPEKRAAEWRLFTGKIMERDSC